VWRTRQPVFGKFPTGAEGMVRHRWPSDPLAHHEAVQPLRLPPLSSSASVQELEIKQFFLDYRAHISDFRLALTENDHSPRFLKSSADENWDITSPKRPGGRHRRADCAASAITSTPPFMMTYGEGVSRLTSTTWSNAPGGRPGWTVTGVHPTSSSVRCASTATWVERVQREADPGHRLGKRRYFVSSRTFLATTSDDKELFFELEPCRNSPRSTADGETNTPTSGRHGYLQDYQRLTEIWASVKRPWKVWDDRQVVRPAPRNASESI